MSNLILVFFFFLLVFVWVLPIFLKVFSFFGVRATILNPKSHYTPHVKLDFGVFLLSACVCMGFAYILKVFSFFGVRAAILNPKRHYTRHVKLDFGGVFFSLSVCACMGFAYIFAGVFVFWGQGSHPKP